MFCGDDIEDEFHFSIVKHFKVLEIILLSHIIGKKPSMYKFIQPLSSNNIRELCNLRKCLFRSFKLRNDLIFSA
jgi:hypothetical protein